MFVWLIERLALGVILYFVESTPLVYLTLGVVLILLAAFFPRRQSELHASGHAQARIPGASVKVIGTLRFVLAFAGIILIVVAAAEGTRGFTFLN